MQKQQIDTFILSHGKDFETEMIPMMRKSLENLPEESSSMLIGAEFKSPTTALILSIFLGSLGVDRFFVGDVALGVVKLLTIGGFGVWTIIDWILITKRTKRANYEHFLKLVNVSNTISA